MKPLILLLVFAATVFAQSPRKAPATVTGSVYDSQHHQMPAVVLLIENKETGFLKSTTTGSDGSFMFTGVPAADDYKLTASKADGTQIGAPRKFSLKPGERYKVQPPLSEIVILKGADAELASMTSGKGLAVRYNGETTLVDLVSKPHQEMKCVNPHDKNEHAYSCVPLALIFEDVEVPHGEQLRGRDSFSLIVTAAAKDNYHVVFSLAELDEATGPTKAYVCDAEDGKPLSENEAPLKLLVTTDKRPARSIRMLTGLVVKTTQ